uniref:AB hydrolase-1 domain-containing protein n=1 Tax=Haemonchus contortus TaxID=6289 RepID=A0A7I4YJI3_HAECO
MVFVEPQSLLERAVLTRPIPENARKLAHLVEVTERRIDVGDHSVFYREALPPDSHYTKAAVVFLHGQSYSSSTWTDRGSLSTFAALGYHCIAPDLPGSGQTRGPAISVHDKPQFLLAFLSVLGVKQVMVVTASMAAQYVLPLLTQDIFVCVVGIAPSNTHEITQPSLYRTPILVLWGDHDTSLGPTAAANLRVLPNVRLHKIPNAGHACYLNNHQAFEEVCMNFFDLIRNYHAL